MTQEDNYQAYSKVKVAKKAEEKEVSSAKKQYASLRQSILNLPNFQKKAERGKFLPPLPLIKREISGPVTVGIPPSHQESPSKEHLIREIILDRNRIGIQDAIKVIEAEDHNYRNSYICSVTDNRRYKTMQKVIETILVLKTQANKRR